MRDILVALLAQRCAQTISANVLKWKKGANEQIINMRGEYVLIMQGNKPLIPLTPPHRILIIGNIKHDATITGIKLN